MATNQIIKANPSRVIVQPQARSWQATLVGVRRHDAAHRLTQVYQLLLDWPKSSLNSKLPPLP